MVIKKLENPDSFPRMAEGKVFSSQADDGYKMPAKYTFNKCYVAKMGEISLASDAFNTVTNFQVTFNYETYEYLYKGDNDENRYKHMDDQ